jgi:hypothetical protein
MALRDAVQCLINLPLYWLSPVSTEDAEVASVEQAKN